MFPFDDVIMKLTELMYDYSDRHRESIVSGHLVTQLIEISMRNISLDDYATLHIMMLCDFSSARNVNTCGPFY